MAEQEIWDLWYPGAAAQGLPFARGRLDAAGILLVHAAPDVLDIDIRTDQGERLASARGLPRTDDRPMARLTRHGAEITREDCWPMSADIDRPVILPGGEVGILRHWWNADDGTEWRWSIELYNHR